MGSWGRLPVETASKLSPERAVRKTRQRERWEEGMIVLREAPAHTKEEARVTGIE